MKACPIEDPGIFYAILFFKTSYKRNIIDETINKGYDT